MWFKKRKTSSYTKKSKSIPYTVGILGIFSIFILGISISNAVKHIDFDLVRFHETAQTELWEIISNTKKEEHSINILLVWRWGWDHDAPDLTDTIILAKIDTSIPSITMLSLPRDLYVEYTSSKNEKRDGKINRIYEDNLIKWEQYAIDKLANKVSEITWQKIDYYVNVDFEWFVEIIDVLDGVEVTVTENLVDNQFPDDNLWYDTFILRKWTWNLDGETALKYARSRYSTSDFDRSIRQQQVIKGIQTKIMDLWYLRSPTKTKNLYSAIRRNIKTDLDIKTILSLATTLKKAEEVEVNSYNINDSCFYGQWDCSLGGLLYYPERYLFDNLSVLLPDWSLPNDISDYKKLQKYTNIIFNEREIFDDAYEINVFNATKTPGLATQTAENIGRFWFNIPAQDSVWNIRDQEFKESVLYYNSIDKNSSTLRNLKEFLNIRMEEVEFPLFSDKIETKIEIVIWDDYEDIVKVGFGY